VIASLWNVDDAATSLLMERFYTHLKAGMGKAAALRQAQLETMAEYPDPYYWAAFVLSGDGGRVSRGQESQAQERRSVAEQESAEARQTIPGGRLIFWGGVLLIVVVAGGVLWRRQRATP
jgi:hypothetical protein